MGGQAKNTINEALARAFTISTRYYIKVEEHTWRDDDAQRRRDEYTYLLTNYPCIKFL